MFIRSLPQAPLSSATIPDPYTPPDGTFNVTGAIAASTTITAGTGLTVTTGGAAVTGASTFTGNINPGVDATYSLGSTSSLRWISNMSRLTITGTASVAGSGAILTTTIAADTAITAGSENRNLYFNQTGTVTWATGALALQRFFHITNPTIAFVGPSTCTETATISIFGPPVQGTNATLTNTYGLHIMAGQVSTGGTITVAASLYIAGAPTTSGGTITNAYSFFGDAGSYRFDTLQTVASATSAVLDAFNIPADTITVSGSTAITTATGFNLVNVGIPALSTAANVTNSATVYIAGAPSISGGGAITNAYSVWTDDGIVRHDVENLTTTQIAGLDLRNTTASTVGVPVQNSPMMRMRGTVWDTDDLVSRTMDYAFYVAPVSGTGFTTTQFMNLVVSLDGAAPTTIATFRQDGVIQAFGANGAWRGSDSAASSPTFGWTADTNNGLFRNTTDQWSGSAAGVSRFLVAANAFNVLSVQTIASGASATLEVFEVTAGTVTISGSTNITTATGFNVANHDKVTYSNASLAVTAAASVYFNGAPDCTGGMSIISPTIIRAGGASGTYPTSAGFTYSGIQLDAHTVTLSGTTQVTSACGFAGVRIGIPTATDASAVTIDAMAAVYIQGAAAQAGSVTGTLKYSLWIDAGLPRIDSVTANGTVACVLTPTVGPTGANTAVQEWLTIDINGTTRFLPVW